jgi:mannose-6-phosphate isomerase-like protein (cupin superfamily)
MLAIALLTGLLTGWDKDETSDVSAELQNRNIGSNFGGLSGTTLAEEENKSALSPSLRPAPDPIILEKGNSSLAIERKNVEKKVQATARLIETQGEELFPKFREKGSAWYQDDFCIFIWTIDGTQIVCPSDTSNEGKDMKGLVAADENPIGEIFIETALSEKGEGWIEYKLQKSGSSELSTKCTFVKRASFGEQSYIVGVDLDLDKYITCRNLEDCKSTEKPGNIHISELLNPESRDKNLNMNCSIAHSILEPGGSIAPHLMKNPEVYYILEGEGLLYIDGLPVELKKDQIVSIPANSIQTTYNTGNTALEFLVIDEPAWAEKNMQIL